MKPPTAAPDPEAAEPTSPEAPMRGTLTEEEAPGIAAALTFKQVAGPE